MRATPIPRPIVVTPPVVVERPQMPVNEAEERQRVLDYLTARAGSWQTLHTLRAALWFGRTHADHEHLLRAVRALLAAGEIDSRGGGESSEAFMVRAIKKGT